jgi:hypothetical protein
VKILNPNSIEHKSILWIKNKEIFKEYEELTRSKKFLELPPIKQFKQSKKVLDKLHKIQ